MRRRVKEVRDKIVPVLRRYDVVRAAMFGSFVRGQMGESSDIDILVEFEGEKSLLDLVALKMELEEVLGRGADVLTYESLHPLIKDAVLKEQVVVL